MPDRILISNDNINKASWKRLKPEMLCHNGKVSVAGFLYAILSTASISLVLITFLPSDIRTSYRLAFCVGVPIVIHGISNVIAYFVANDEDFSILKRATALGLVFGLSLLSIVFASNEWKRFGVYFLFMSAFHFSEYIAIAYANPQTLSIHTFMLNHSPAYLIAAATSWLEFIVEVWLWPWMKQSVAILLLGIFTCIAGEILRKLAIVTANTNFNHVVQYQKKEDHTLVTHGVYRIMRHPSYAGWFWWSIGTQIILANPVCIVIYTIVSWKFFHERILVEEVTLVNFFLEKYVEYQLKTPTGVPFVRGYVDGAYDEAAFK